MTALKAFEAAFDLKAYSLPRREAVETRLAQYLTEADPKVLWESMRYSVMSGGKRLRALLCIATAECIFDYRNHHHAQQQQQQQQQQQHEQKEQQELAPPLQPHGAKSGLNETKTANDGIETAYGIDATVLDTVLPTACAIELVHAMSLIHDDLPCLDNDDLRRGKPTNHKVFGEAIALLAGDALLIYANEILIKGTRPFVDSEILLTTSMELSQALGASGMVGGQVDDLMYTELFDRMILPEAIQKHALSQKVDEKLLASIHDKKTGALISFAVTSGARLAGASSNQLQCLKNFAAILGLAFQIADDLLDVTGDMTTLGKTPGKDAAAGKTTWVQVFGEEKAKTRLEELRTEGETALLKTEVAFNRLVPLKALLDYAIDRTN